ncbi:MAG: hypothetical protein WBE48_14715 [Xanthobacteraceae bacterium]|jgi:hypothetical protein
MQIDRIMLTSLGPNGMSNDDRAYLAQIVGVRNRAHRETRNVEWTT